MSSPAISREKRHSGKAFNFHMLYRLDGSQEGSRRIGEEIQG